MTQVIEIWQGAAPITIDYSTYSINVSVAPEFSVNSSNQLTLNIASGLQINSSNQLEIVIDNVYIINNSGTITINLGTNYSWAGLHTFNSSTNIPQFPYGFYAQNVNINGFLSVVNSGFGCNGDPTVLGSWNSNAGMIGIGTWQSEPAIFMGNLNNTSPKLQFIYYDYNNTSYNILMSLNYQGLLTLFGTLNLNSNSIANLANYQYLPSTGTTQYPLGARYLAANVKFENGFSTDVFVMFITSGSLTTSSYSAWATNGTFNWGVLYPGGYIESSAGITIFYIYLDNVD